MTSETHLGLYGQSDKPQLTHEEFCALEGTELGTSDWLLVDQRMIDEFAELTGDRQYIHLDHERAARGPFGTTIAHGFLTLSLIGGWIPGFIPELVGSTAGLNYGFDRLRLVSPVRSGSRVRGVFELTSTERRPSGDLTAHVNTTVEIEGEEKPALVADWLIVFHLTDS